MILHSWWLHNSMSAARRLKGLKAVTKWIQMVGRGWKRGRSCFTASKTTSWSCETRTVQIEGRRLWHALPLQASMYKQNQHDGPATQLKALNTRDLWCTFPSLRTCQDKVNDWCFVIGCSFVTWRLEKATDDSMSPFFLVPSANIRGHLELVWRKTWKLRQFQVGNSGNVDCHCDLYMVLFFSCLHDKAAIFLQLLRCQSQGLAVGPSPLDPTEFYIYVLTEP